ncbi:nitrogen fixation protein NifZ [Mesorhizobium sangaii]|uniref:Nitrogen fixation protein NifZ n=2 Tax=Mesorhizobium sangaii TaxID=505389 RepID=A0A841PIU7_9HYPH|nr:nitrogen fixation protein NifZ [Mesorhizobium sangaii]
MSGAEDLRSCLNSVTDTAGSPEGPWNSFADNLQPREKEGTAMWLGREQEVEIRKPPRFMPGERVRATRHIKNDGTYPGREIGENLVRKGDEGYVRDIGTFLQRFFIYAVEWVDRGTIVGMRARELMSLDKAEVPCSVQSTANRGAAR